ncbi:hypothetical protein HW452_05085 [Halomonas aquamarina]|uniref:Uncharacterized protein n=1 Tax=Vreelandella aquamarina TaxID=77097 RepID=A0ACC5VSE8_9GAMM|nr:hypothetical protein [Halomonas aquamarina]MBZ5486895.1 hypothetical protein [Halomonas aquamarina]
MRLLIAVALALVLAGCNKDAPSEAELGRIADASDDADIYSNKFRQAAHEISGQSGCSAQAMENNAGFWRVPEIEEAPVYFIYCAEPMHSSNRYYLNADSGKISKVKDSVY